MTVTDAPPFVGAGEPDAVEPAPDVPGADGAAVGRRASESSDTAPANLGE
jgi:hypothetical protein